MTAVTNYEPWAFFRSRLLYARNTEIPVQRGSIVAIQALRWLAASLIVVVHSEQEIAKLAVRHHLPVHFGNPIEFGVGVDIFFIISGFLIHCVSRRQFQVPAASWDFIRRRILRVLPLYWLATVGMLIAIASVPQVINHNHLEPLQVAMSFLMIAWPDPEGRIAPLLNLGWTLNLEVYFYGVFAIALLAREGLAVTLLAAYFSMTVALASLWSEAGWPLRFYGKPIVLEFVFGIMLSTLFARGLRVKLRAAVIVGIFAVLLHVILWNLSGWLNTGRVIENGLPACLLFFACVFAETAPFSPPAAAFLRLMGDSSYALYLTSPFAINLSAEVLSGRGVNDPMTIVAAVFIISTLVAVAVHRLVELPITRFGRRLLARRQQKVLANLPPPATASVRGQPVA